MAILSHSGPQAWFIAALSAVSALGMLTLLVQRGVTYSFDHMVLNQVDVLHGSHALAALMKTIIWAGSLTPFGSQEIE